MKIPFLRPDATHEETEQFLRELFRLAAGEPPTPRGKGFGASTGIGSRTVEYPARLHIETYSSGGKRYLQLTAHEDWGGQLLAIQWVDETDEGNVPYLTAFVLLDERARKGKGDYAYTIEIELPDEADGLPAVSSISPQIEDAGWFEGEYRSAFARPSVAELTHWLEAQAKAAGSRGRRIAAWRKMLQRLAGEAPKQSEESSCSTQGDSP